MKKIMSGLIIAAAVVSGARPLPAAERGRVSPHDTVSAVVDGSRVTVVYGRPYSKDPKSGKIRKIWGGLVPFGQPWRLGADEATLLVVEKPVLVGETRLDSGAYSLFFLPEEKGPSKLIISKQVGQWGTQYDPSQDLARVDAARSFVDASKPATANVADQLAVYIGKNGSIDIDWENTRFSVPLRAVK